MKHGVRLDLQPVLRNAAYRPALTELVAHSSGYTFLNDREEMLDDLLDARREAAALENSVRRFEYRPGDEEALIQTLKSLDGKATTFQGGIGLVVASPFFDDRYTLSATAFTRFAGTFEFVEDDEPKLRLAPVIAFFQLSDLESRARVLGYGMAEVALHRKMDEIDLPATTVSLSFKYQGLSLYEREVPIQDYRESEFFELSGFTREYRRANVDIATLTEIDRWQIGLTLRDLFESTYRGPRDSTFHLRTRGELRVDYRFDWGQASLLQDLTPHPAFGQIKGRRETVLGISAPISSRFVAGAAYTHIARDRDHDTVSLSLTYHLLDSFNIGVTGTLASERELGGAFRLQMPF
ncbi:hypothetical protein FHR99_000225 [Litorivivens lipolytica]|uniref:Uncharacterized protein n=1 Tax=Litorivivens lipolytica TaxID=1524264 RepID=A0A7W4W320_9GAMM|nr:hypothetical protein [Litorivivens lipolytica]